MSLHISKYSCLLGCSEEFLPPVCHCSVGAHSFMPAITEPRENLAVTSAGPLGDGFLCRCCGTHTGGLCRGSASAQAQHIYSVHEDSTREAEASGSVPPPQTVVNTLALCHVASMLVQAMKNKQHTHIDMCLPVSDLMTHTGARMAWCPGDWEGHSYIHARMPDGCLLLCTGVELFCVCLCCFAQFCLAVTKSLRLENLQRHNFWEVLGLFIATHSHGNLVPQDRTYS